ncbi:hypothetical protein B2G52_02170 [Neisseria lactamica]|uniref:Uncharacterized protein n=2 Tax=Neisseria lactamica TaxID=486 RepID=A0AAU8VCR9_NEILA|nr:hypothetical protein B2G52_02170 [Neisseria lactamica]
MGRAPAARRLFPATMPYPAGRLRTLKASDGIFSGGGGKAARLGLDTRLLPFIADEQKPVRRCLALAQRERFSKVLKHQVNRFRTICTVCGFVALS